jgi:hypothetical protein
VRSQCAHTHTNGHRHTPQYLRSVRTQADASERLRGHAKAAMIESQGASPSPSRRDESDDALTPLQVDGCCVNPYHCITPARFMSLCRFARRGCSPPFKSLGTVFLNTRDTMLVCPFAQMRHDIVAPFHARSTLPCPFVSTLERQQAHTDLAPTLKHLCRCRRDSTRRLCAAEIHSVYSLAAAVKYLAHLGWQVPCALTSHACLAPTAKQGCSW